MPHRYRLLILSLSLLLMKSGVDAAEINFQETIRPLLEQKCLSCHNSHDKKGGLSLETAELLMQGGESGSVITPGRPDASYLMAQITPHDGKAAMPKGNQPLSADEIAVITSWIEQGVAWPANLRLYPEVWWSLRPLSRPPVPTPAENLNFTVRTPIDAFILHSLNQHGLYPSPEADRRTLIRRLYFDLIGLPPHPDEIEAFVSDPNPQAYEQLVDQLLASKQYGERWARHWLDVVKYADTCGFDKDKLRPNAWPYRDYVIRSFNEDKTFTRFVQEQIAGDVLFPGETDGILGLGFLAAGPWDHIGHVEVPETKIDGQIARSLDRDEIISNVMNTFCSATIQCCRCHDHKFDPFKQEHYYGLQAVFAAVDRADRAYDLDPQIERDRLDLKRDLDAAHKALATLDEAIQREGGERLTQLTERVANLKQASQPKSKDPRYGYHSRIESHPDAKKWVQLDLGEPVGVTRIILRPCHDDFGGIGSGFGFPVRYKVEVAAQESQFDAKSPTEVPAQIVSDQSLQDVANPGLAPVEIIVAAGKCRFIRITALKLAPRTNDYIFALAEVQVINGAGNNVALAAQVSAMDSIDAPVRWGRKNLTDGIWPAAMNESAPRNYAAALAELSRLKASLQSESRIRKRSELTARMESLQQRIKELPEGKLVYAAATQFTPQGNFQPTRGVPRPVFVLHRGNVQSPGVEALPGTIPVIPSASFTLNLAPAHTEGDRRAALAQWITRTDNPLTWRSIVNRIWQFHFGEGLCGSPNDFGRMGQKPTHPELLDWLAMEFRDGEQSVKKLHRLLVTSSVYRQSSSHQAANALIDGSNQYLWRMNRRRLEAEEIRDAVLAVSGRLNSTMEGPGYYLFVLEKPEHSPHYEYRKFNPSDPRSHRRSIYRFIVRSQPDPYLTTLDCADSSQSTPRRNETVTALQALSLQNSDFNLLMARQFAERLRSEVEGADERILRSFALVTGRRPTNREQQVMAEYAQDFGLENLCRMLLNLNEFLYID